MSMMQDMAVVGLMLSTVHREMQWISDSGNLRAEFIYAVISIHHVVIKSIDTERCKNHLNLNH
jgi:hypothetical protein